MVLCNCFLKSFRLLQTKISNKMWIHWTVTCGISFIINKGRSHNHVMKNNILKFKQQPFNPFQVLILKLKRSLALSASQRMKPRPGCPGRKADSQACTARQVSWAGSGAGRFLLTQRRNGPKAAAVPRPGQERRGVWADPAPTAGEQLGNSWNPGWLQGARGAQTEGDLPDFQPQPRWCQISVLCPCTLTLRGWGEAVL